MRSRLGQQGESGSPVNVDAIPFLEGDYDVFGVEKYGLIGDAPKDYVVYKTSQRPEFAFIAKKPRIEGPIECVTEYLIARIGASLPLRVAEGRLAQLRTGGTEPDVRFLSRPSTLGNSGPLMLGRSDPHLEQAASYVDAARSSEQRRVWTSWV
jgi:hypothetical protein